MLFACHHFYRINRVRTCFSQQKTEDEYWTEYAIRLATVNVLVYVQHAAARLVNGYDHVTTYTSALRELNWLPIAQRIEYKLCLLVHKSIVGPAPVCLPHPPSWHKLTFLCWHAVNTSQSICSGNFCLHANFLGRLRVIWNMLLNVLP